MDLPDHPKIACALETGYPTPRKSLDWRCLYCDREMGDDNTLFDYDGDLICDECFVEKLTEDMSAEDLAKRLGFICKPVAAFAEELEF